MTAITAWDIFVFSLGGVFGIIVAEVVELGLLHFGILQKWMKEGGWSE